MYIRTYVHMYICQVMTNVYLGSGMSLTSFHDAMASLSEVLIRLNSQFARMLSTSRALAYKADDAPDPSRREEGRERAESEGSNGNQGLHGGRPKLVFPKWGVIHNGDLFLVRTGTCSWSEPEHLDPYSSH